MAGDAAAATSRAAQVSKLQAEILYLKNRVCEYHNTTYRFARVPLTPAVLTGNQIDTQKREFGVAVFDHMRAGTQEVVQQALTPTFTGAGLNISSCVNPAVPPAVHRNDRRTRD